jgi:protein SCO1/2
MVPKGRRRETRAAGGGDLKRPALWWAIASLGVVIVAALAWRLARPAEPAPSDIGGAFHLVSQTGAPVDQRLLLGKWSAVFFGYTYCPDVCPTTLATLGQAAAALGDRAGRFQVVFVSVDPERDTPRALADYLSSPAFPKATLGLTGSPAEVARIARAYHVYYQKVPQGSSYSMDHSAVVYLMNPEGRFVRPLDVGVPPTAVARQIVSAMDEG